MLKSKLLIWNIVFANRRRDLREIAINEKIDLRMQMGSV